MTVESKPKPATSPRGTYDALIVNVATVRRMEDRSHVLRVIVRTISSDTDLIAWQGLADDHKDDPFELTEAQHRSLERFAERLDITEPLTPPSIVAERLMQMCKNGQVVQAKVSHTKVGQKVTLSVPAIVVADGAEPTENGAKAAHEAHERLVKGLQGVRIALAYAGSGCYQLRESEGWKALGHETLNEYLASPEVTLKRSEFYRLASIWERYVLDGGLEPEALKGASETKLEIPLRALGEGLVTVNEAVADATSMPREDLRLKYAELLGEEEPEPSRRRDNVPVDVARSLTAMLQRVLDEVGRPEQKRMSNALREAVREVLALAHEHALDVEDS